MELTTARATYRQVKARYASVQHTFTDSQRRLIRKRLAQMTTLIRQAQDEAWLNTFMSSKRTPLSPQKKRNFLGMLSDAFKLK
jgi:hypothetical protein